MTAEWAFVCFGAAITLTAAIIKIGPFMFKQNGYVSRGTCEMRHRFLEEQIQRIEDKLDRLLERQLK